LTIELAQNPTGQKQNKSHKQFNFNSAFWAIDSNSSCQVGSKNIKKKKTYVTWGS